MQNIFKQTRFLLKKRHASLKKIQNSSNCFSCLKRDCSRATTNRIDVNMKKFESIVLKNFDENK